MSTCSIYNEYDSVPCRQGSEHNPGLCGLVLLGEESGLISSGRKMGSLWFTHKYWRHVLPWCVCEKRTKAARSGQSKIKPLKAKKYMYGIRVECSCDLHRFATDMPSEVDPPPPPVMSAGFRSVDNF